MPRDTDPHGHADRNHPDKPVKLNDEQLARRLEEVAALLEDQDANPYRTRAYRNAARTLRRLDKPAQQILDTQGVAGLIRLPGIGSSLAGSIQQLLQDGKLGLLERLRGESDPEHAFRTIPGIGPHLAHQVHEQLGIETLAELEAAALDGRLARVPGMGPRRVRAVRESLVARFVRPDHTSRQPAHEPSGDQPPVSELLDVDREYRHKAAAHRLPRIAPRRFNPTGQAWLPVLHTQRGPRHYTSLYSNTARAHELGTTRDWVVIYRDDHEGDGQWTVVTARFGPLQGKRIVRGREDECEEQEALSASNGCLPFGHSHVGPNGKGP